MIGTRLITSEDINLLDTSKQEQYGALGTSSDGRFYRYVGFGGTATINAGLILVAGAKTANSNALAITAVGTGGQLAANLNPPSTQLVVTNGATAVTQDQFADGFLEVLWSGGNLTVRINGNTAAAASGYITFSLADQLLNNVALVPGTDTVNVTASPYSAVAPSLTQSAPIGASVVQVANSASVTNYGWVQVRGHALLSATSATKGQSVKQDTAGTAGYVATAAASTDFEVGVAKESAANSAAPVELSLD